MKIPKFMKEKQEKRSAIIYTYRFVRKCNNNLYLYEEVKYKWKRCFTKFDLGLIKNEKIEVEK